MLITIMTHSPQQVEPGNVRMMFIVICIWKKKYHHIHNFTLILQSICFQIALHIRAIFFTFNLKYKAWVGKLHEFELCINFLHLVSYNWIFCLIFSQTWYKLNSSVKRREKKKTMFNPKNNVKVNFQYPGANFNI